MTRALAGLLALLGGCADDTKSADSAAPVEESFAPARGDWTAHFGQTWGGDCALDDLNTYLPEDDHWVVEADPAGFAYRIDFGYRYICLLTGMDFVCELPAQGADLRDEGYDIVAVYAPVVSGSFLSEDTLSGTYSVQATCEGEDCGLIVAWGEGFSFPCTAETSLEAAAD